MEDISKLIEKYIEGSISEKDRDVLRRWVLENLENHNYFQNCIKQSSKETFNLFDEEVAYEKFLATIKTKKAKNRSWKHIYKYAAIFIGFVSFYFLANDYFSEKREDVIATSVGQETENHGKIVIRLANGTTKTVDIKSNEVLLDENGSIIATKDKKTLSFVSSKLVDTEELVFNEVYIPYGEKFKIILSDGTMVWLNSGSKLRFPKTFIETSNSRTVYLDGEAFFDVTKNANKPFIVNTEKINVKVLGTQFNLSSYESDDSIATTLIEGSVSVYEKKSPEKDLLLKPSFQAKYTKEDNSFKQYKVDTSIYTSWMQDKLIIDNLKFPEILKKLERIHHVTFINKAINLNNKIYKGEFDNENLEAILKTISLSTPFIYKMEHEVITITEK